MASSRQKSRLSGASKTIEKEQIQDLLFSLQGRAMTVPADLGPHPIIINARGDSTLTYSMMEKKALGNNKPKSRVALSLTPEETQELGEVSSLFRYLVVGWMPASEGKSKQNPAARAKHGSPIGVQRPPASEIIDYRAEEGADMPILAVVKVSDHEPTGKTCLLAELQRIVELVDEDISHARAGMVMAHSFVSLAPDMDFGKQEAKILSLELRMVWPDVIVSAALLLFLRKGIVRRQLSIDHAMLKPFIIEAAHLVDQTILEGELDYIAVMDAGSGDEEEEEEEEDGLDTDDHKLGAGRAR
ncbi:hypothetical protein EJ04DRAFT_565313 [Polyplosphaeria fusca]|uniref:Uncharacterized protein n=1 Tax=Polyplosphaeria fusca TaxID=682080 RepID=A0A9P4V1F5_9PLEO|nr:hypothetical protein EJ04DRAFT_565313 [Polyplosphaeria fusca]